jgi:hypothetical protein
VARLDPQDLKLQVESAEAELAAATSNLAQAAADLERYTTLRGRGYASVADFERKRAANDEAEGRLERAQRSLDLARNQHGYADLKADADGVITATLAEPGQVVAVGQAVARLAHRGEKEAVVALARDLARAKRASPGRPCVVVGPRARLRRAAARTFAAGRSRDPHLRGALHHHAGGRRRRIRHDRDRDAHARRDAKGAKVPLRRFSTAAPDHRSMSSIDRCACSAAGNGRVVRRGCALVTSGVDDGDKVVTLGVQKLEAGLKVRTVEIR